MQSWRRFSPSDLDTWPNVIGDAEPLCLVTRYGELELITWDWDVDRWRGVTAWMLAPEPYEG